MYQDIKEDIVNKEDNIDKEDIKEDNINEKQDIKEYIVYKEDNINEKQDIKEDNIDKEDIVEEIVRIYGYDKIPLVPLPANNVQKIINREQRRFLDIKR